MFITSARKFKLFKRYVRLKIYDAFHGLQLPNLCTGLEFEFLGRKEKLGFKPMLKKNTRKLGASFNSELAKYLFSGRI